jgi:hypothetical protein
MRLVLVIIWTRKNLSLNMSMRAGTNNGYCIPASLQ